MKQIEIQDDRARLVVLPALGAGVASYEAHRPDGTTVPLLRSWKPSAGDDPFSLACNLLLPWSNRISGGGFSYEGRFHPLTPNYPGSKFPLHGNGFQVPWTLRDHTASSVTLELRDTPIGPFCYAATVCYTLRAGSLDLRLTVENQGNETLPYGMGFHPWFPRHAKTRLFAPAATVWHEDAEHLPTHEEPVARVPDWDFRQSKRLPQGWINNGFTGWSRKAEIIQPEDGVKLSLSASEMLGCYLLYSASAQSDFFCFEPVSHLVDAHNRAVDHGLVPLKPGGQLVGTMHLDWELTGQQF